MTWFEALWCLAGVLLTESGPAGLLIGAGAVAGVLLMAALAASLLHAGRVPARPSASRRMLRERARRTGIPRHRDPDADGRTRPRGPTAAFAAV